MTEQWLPVVGYEGLYEVSDHGRVRSLERQVPNGEGTVRTVRSRILKSGNTSAGRPLVQLWKDGKGTGKHPYWLVLEAFVGPRPEGMQACHWDDNPHNNKLENLRWGTPSENWMDMVRNGNHVQARKTRCPQGHKYTPENTYRQPSKPNSRVCRTCRRDNDRKRNRSRQPN